MFPKMPFAPTLRLTKSAVAVVADPGDQSKLASPPLVSAVDVELNANPKPVVNPLNVPPIPLPVVMPASCTSNLAAGAVVPNPNLLLVVSKKPNGVLLILLN